MKTGILLMVSVLVPAMLIASEQVAILSGEVEVLRYQAQPLSNPVGNEKNSADKFRASHFIHPLKTPSGFVVSASQPADHLHHFGLWWPWKYIQNDDRKLITWELQAGQGYVRATHCQKTDHGLIAEAEYVDRLAEGGPVALLRETATITVSETIEQPARGYFLDISISQTPAVDREVTVTQYRYSGFSLRGTLYWNNDNSSLLTSAGKDRRNGNSTRARWVQFQGATPAGHVAGILMMSHPGNRNHPEPIRIWNQNSHHGAFFANFNSVMSKSWVFQPGQTYTRKYRLFVYDGEFAADQAETLWNAYGSFASADVEPSFFVFDNGLTDIKSPEEQARLLKELGYDGICTRPINASKEFYAAFDEQGVNISATYIVVSAGVRVLPSVVVKHIESLKGRDTLVWLGISNTKASDDEAVETIRRVCDLAKTNGLDVVLYPHVGFRTDTVERTDYLCRLANRSNLGISFNLCHFLAQNDAKKLEATIHEIAPHLKLVQLSGANHIPPGKPDWSQLILLLGEGNFDVGRVFQTLDEIGYKGPVNLQCYKISQPTIQHLTTSINTWRKYHAKP